MIETSTGLVLRTRPLTETSLIVHWLTPDLGRIATVAKGARRPKSAFRGKLDLFYSLDFSFARSRASELHNLREVGLLETRQFLRKDLALLQQASYAATLIEKSTETETPLEVIYELIIGFLRFLEMEGDKAQGLFAFEAKLLDELGLSPNLESSRLPPGTRLILSNLRQSDRDTLNRLKLSADQKGEIRHFLNGIFTHNFGKLTPPDPV
jgi:DNA repair protein RecO